MADSWRPQTRNPKPRNPKPISPQPHFFKSCACGNHREHVLFLRDDNVQHHRSRGSQPALKNASKLAWCRCSEAGCAIRLGKLHEIWKPSHLHRRIVPAVEDLLPLTSHPQITFCHPYYLLFCLGLHPPGHVLPGHLKTFVSHKGDDLPVGKPHPPSQGCGKSEAHRAQSPGSERLSG